LPKGARIKPKCSSHLASHERVEARAVRVEGHRVDAACRALRRLARALGVRAWIDRPQREALVLVLDPRRRARVEEHAPESHDATGEVARVDLEVGARDRERAVLPHAPRRAHGERFAEHRLGDRLVCGGLVDLRQGVADVGRAVVEVERLGGAVEPKGFDAQSKHLGLALGGARLERDDEAAVVVEDR
jgi:hypothetical protein